MASKPIYQFYAELEDFKPTIWRRFQVMNDITVARLGYIVQVLFEMTASHLMALEAPEAENHRISFQSQYPEMHESFVERILPDLVEVRRYEITNEDCAPFAAPSDDAYTADATTTRLRSVVSMPNHKLRLNYDFGDDWWVSLTLEKVFDGNDLPGSELPRVLEGAGFGIVEDIGGVGGLDIFAKAFKKKKGAEYEDFKEWLGVDDFDITAFDIDDMNFRLKKIPRIYKQSYEDGLEPTQQSINLITRKYLKKKK